MLEHDDRMSNEHIRLNINFRKIEPSKEHKTIKSTTHKFSHNITEPIKRQKLKPDDISFEKLPIQKLVPVPFMKCVRSLNIERSDDLIYFNFKMQQNWLEFLIRKIRYGQGDLQNISSSPSDNSKLLNVDVVDVDGQVMYTLFTKFDCFHMTFSEKYTDVYMVCGTEYLVEIKGCTKKQIPQKEIRKGLINYIMCKWTN